MVEPRPVGRNKPVKKEQKMCLKADPTEWLLEESDPSVRYFTLRDLLKRNSKDSDLVQTQKMIPHSQRVSEIFTSQEKSGYWFNPDRYRNKVKMYGTFYRFILLSQLGMEGRDDRIKITAEYLLDKTWDSSDGAFRIEPHGDNVNLKPPCTNAQMLLSFIRFGYLNDYRIQKNLNWILDHARFDDGVVENPPNWMTIAGTIYQEDACYGRHSCIRGVLPIIRAISEIPRTERSEKTQRIINDGINFILRHHIYKRSHNPKRVMNGWITKLGEEAFCNPDFLYILDIITREGCSDPRMNDAIKLLIKKQNNDGKWCMEQSIDKPTPIALPAKGETSKWITLKAMCVLKRLNLC